MSVKYKYSGLTPELYQRLVDEHAVLRQTHKKAPISSSFKRCDSAVKCKLASFTKRLIVQSTVDRLEGIISDELFNDLQDYLSTNYTRGKTTRPVLEKTNAGLPEGLFKRFRKEVEELHKGHPNNLNNYIRGVKDCDQKNANRTQNALNLCYAEKPL